MASEWERHRTQSYSQMSMRYIRALPQFWIPDSRFIGEPLNKMKPIRTEVDEGDFLGALSEMKSSFDSSWMSYSYLVSIGVAFEVARFVLPVGTYTQFWASANLVNWLRFLSLRTYDPNAAVVSYPQMEIEIPARKVEDIVAELFPHTYTAWVENGRII